MSWHKGGFTERMANIMLCGSVLATDATTYLQRDYTKEDMIVFFPRCSGNTFGTNSDIITE